MREFLCRRHVLAWCVWRTRYDGKELIDYVNTYMKAEGDIEWGVAFHPYGIHLRRQSGGMIMQPLMKMAIFISMENISVLTGYLCKKDCEIQMAP